MLSKENAFQMSRAAEATDLQNEITAATSRAEYRLEILNLTEYQQSLLTDGGFKFVASMNKLGANWIITWD